MKKIVRDDEGQLLGGPNDGAHFLMRLDEQVMEIPLEDGRNAIYRRLPVTVVNGDKVTFQFEGYVEP